MNTDGYLKIEFKDEIYYFSGDNLEDGGCIELQPAMDDKGVSWAYLNPAPDSRIMQYFAVLGTIKDIKIVEEE